MLTAKAPLLLILMLAIISLSSVSFLPKHGGEPIKVTGHFSSRDKLQTVWLIPPRINADQMSCTGECNSILKFSDLSTAAILVKSCIGGTPTNLGDLDNDGLDEIGLLPEWFTSCWRSYHVYTFKQHKWIPAVSSFSTHCNQWDEGLPPVVKDPALPHHVIITYSAFEGYDIVIKTKSVPVK
jgi:hypothetical protein